MMSQPTSAIPAVPQPTTWTLEVAGVRELTPRMRRIQLTSPGLATFDYRPGQDASLGFTREDGNSVRRRYTIRGFDRERRLLDLDVVMHGGGPGMRWAQTARAGQSIDVIGPRGKITLVGDAEWHLFAGDATAVPGALAMMEALPADVPARAFLLVDGPDERQPPGSADARVTWHYDPHQSAAGERGLITALSQAALLSGRGHAYLAGEVGLVNALKEALIGRNWTAEQISAKAYWNRGRANAGHGEPEQRAS